MAISTLLCGQQSKATGRKFLAVLLEVQRGPVGVAAIKRAAGPLARAMDDIALPKHAAPASHPPVANENAETASITPAKPINTAAL